MKTKLKNYLKTGFLLMGISFLLWNCEKEYIFETPTENAVQQGPEIKYITEAQV